MEHFHSRGQHTCKFIGTKGLNFYRRKEVNSHANALSVEVKLQLPSLFSEMTKKALSKSDSFLVLLNLSFLPTTTRAPPHLFFMRETSQGGEEMAGALRCFAKEMLFFFLTCFLKRHTYIFIRRFERLMKGTLNGKFPFVRLTIYGLS